MGEKRPYGLGAVLMGVAVAVLFGVQASWGIYVAGACFVISVLVFLWAVLLRHHAS